jgi:serine protease Do
MRLMLALLGSPAWRKLAAILLIASYSLLSLYSLHAEPLEDNGKPKTGTGFFVTNDGYIVTAFHVVRDRKEVRVRVQGDLAWQIADVVNVDEARDLALLHVTRVTKPLVIVDSDEVPVGLEAYVLGFPQVGLQGATLKITQGIISGDEGPRGLQRLFQLSAAIQKGNSGGPVIGPDGKLLGVVQSKLDALKIAEKTGDLSQNVNYAIKARALMKFLNETPVRVTVQKLDLNSNMRPYQITQSATSSVVAIVAKD